MRNLSRCYLFSTMRSLAYIPRGKVHSTLTLLPAHGLDRIWGLRRPVTAEVTAFESDKGRCGGGGEGRGSRRASQTQRAQLTMLPPVRRGGYRVCSIAESGGSSSAWLRCPRSSALGLYDGSCHPPRTYASCWQMHPVSSVSHPYHGSAPGPRSWKVRGADRGRPGHGRQADTVAGVCGVGTSSTGGLLPRPLPDRLLG
ncbi:hypothetical protein VTK56DRAFT_1115 [Thermocarpiscus australiensis]